MFRHRKTYRLSLTLLGLATLLGAFLANSASAGRIGGPAGTQATLPARSFHAYRAWFHGGVPAAVAVIGDGYSDLDLKVYDENGNLVTFDTSLSDNCTVAWTPRWDGVFEIRVENLGRVHNTYAIGMN